MTNDKLAFFEKYENCAEKNALERIWEAKVTNAIEFSISHTQVSDLSPLKDLTQLKQLDVSETQC